MENNVYSIFENLVTGINIRGNAHVLMKSIPLGVNFRIDSLLNRFYEIVEKNLLNNSDKLSSDSSQKTINKYAEELCELLPIDSRLEAFILIYNKLFNINTNEIVKSYSGAVKNLAAKLSIDKYTYNSIESFYKNNKFDDLHDTCYIVGPNHNQLCSANGSKLIYKGNNGEIIFLKLLHNFNLILTKKINITKRYDQLNEIYTIENIALLKESSFNNYFQNNISIEEAIEAISKPTATNHIEISPTEIFPYILLDPKKGQVVIKGVSTPISPLIYLEPILDWIDLYFTEGKKLEINLSFYYYNTYTTKFLVRLVDKCNTLNKNKPKATIYWNYTSNDDEIRECGEFYKELFSGMPEFKLVPLQSC